MMIKGGEVVFPKLVNEAPPVADNFTAKQRSALHACCAGSGYSSGNAGQKVGSFLRLSLCASSQEPSRETRFCLRLTTQNHICPWLFLARAHVSLWKDLPMSNMTYWDIKRERNKQCDKEHLRSLRAADWRVLVVWECWTRDIARLHKLLADFLD